ncbi:MAG: dual OB domain-containing protein [Labedaea sp.]
MTKKLVCLANSRKHSGRCVAGIEIESKKWVRPVSSRPGHEVSAAERQYRGGVDPRVLDVISIPLLRARPVGFQRENWLLDPNAYWRKIGRIEWGELCALEEQPRTLWINGYGSKAGINDRVPVEQENTLVDSLKLIRVAHLAMEVCPAHPMSSDTRPTLRARFQHAGSAYRLKVTDPLYEERFRAEGIGKYRLGESFLTVSLGEQFERHFYKLVAAIIERANVSLSGG